MDAAKLIKYHKRNKLKKAPFRLNEKDRGYTEKPTLVELENKIILILSPQVGKNSK